MRIIIIFLSISFLTCCVDRSVISHKVAHGETNLNGMSYFLPVGVVDLTIESESEQGEQDLEQNPLPPKKEKKNTDDIRPPRQLPLSELRKISDDCDSAKNKNKEICTKIKAEINIRIEGKPGYKPISVGESPAEKIIEYIQSRPFEEIKNQNEECNKNPPSSANPVKSNVEGILAEEECRVASDDLQNRINGYIGIIFFPSSALSISAVTAANQPPNPVVQGNEIAPPVDEKAAEANTGGIKSINASASSKIFKANPPRKVTIKIDNVRYLPDPNHHYQVNIKHNIFFNDTMKISVGSDGLLLGVNSKTDDQSYAFATRLAKAPGEIISASFPLGNDPRSLLAGGRLDGDDQGEQKKLPAKETYNKTYSIKYSLDPSDTDSRKRLNEILSKLDPEIEFRARPMMPLKNLPAIDAAHPSCEEDLCFRTAMPWILELHTINYADRFPEQDAKQKKTSQSRNIPNGAIFVDDKVVARAVTVLPNKQIVGQIPITRGAFIKKDVALKFTQGMLTEVSVENPSEVLGFVAIPIDVAKAIVGIPSALFQVKVNEVTSDSRLLQAQASNLQLQKQIIDAQTALITAQSAGQ